MQVQVRAPPSGILGGASTHRTRAWLSPVTKPQHQIGSGARLLNRYAGELPGGGGVLGGPITHGTLGFVAIKRLLHIRIPIDVTTTTSPNTQVDQWIQNGRDGFMDARLLITRKEDGNTTNTVG